MKSIALGAARLGLAAAGVNASIADRIFLKFPGITGASTTADHVGEIALNSVQTGMLASIGGAGAPTVKCMNVTVAKAVDKTSPLFIAMTPVGTPPSTQPPVSPPPTPPNPWVATITFESGTAAGAVDYYKIDLAGIQLASVTQSGGV